MTFQFRLQAVLTIRRRERDLLKPYLAIASESYAICVAERDSLVKQRSSVTSEIRRNNDETQWSLDQIIDRQRHSDQLGEAVANADVAVEVAAARLEDCRKQLIAADQSVRILEKLSERQFAEFQTGEAKSAAHELDDAMSARRWAA